MSVVILAGPELTNLGIMKSPGTGSMIISMYYPLFEGKNCIGYVGAGVYASRLMDALLNLDIKGLPNSEYVFLNVENGTYLYHENEELLNTETTDIRGADIKTFKDAFDGGKVFRIFLALLHKSGIFGIGEKILNLAA